MGTAGSTRELWALIASFFVAIVVLLIITLPFAALWAKLLLIPAPYLYAGITVFCMLGIYATSSSWFDLMILLVIGLVGFLMGLYDYPLAPLIIAMVLGPLAETSLRDSVQAADSSFASLFQGPIMLVMWALMLLVLGGAVYAKIKGRTGPAT